MNDQYKERLSAFMDGEVDDAGEVVDALERDAQLQSVWQRYHLIRDALHQRLAPGTDRGFARAVSAALANEPTIMAPRRRNRRNRSVKELAKPAAGMAIAASIAVVAVLGVQRYRAPHNPPPQVAQVQPPPAATTVAADSFKSQTDQRLDAKVQSKLSGYLLNHNEYSASSQVQGILPYTRIVGYTQGKRIGN